MHSGHEKRDRSLLRALLGCFCNVSWNGLNTSKCSITDQCRDAMANTDDSIITNIIFHSQSFTLDPAKLKPTCLHFGLPLECSNSAPAWQCSLNAARCPVRKTTGCTLPASSNGLVAPHLRKKQIQPEPDRKQHPESAVWPQLQTQTDPPPPNRTQPCESRTSVSAHHSSGCKGSRHWGRSEFWRGRQSPPCLVWRAGVCRDGVPQPSSPLLPGSHLPDQ